VSPRVGWAAFSVVAATLPFLFVDFPPCTDLPQHAAQARLFFEALGDPDAPYRIQWATPYSLAYGPLLVLWTLLPPLVAAKAHLLIIAVACTLAIHALASRFDRPPFAAALASIFVFAHPLYWGFLSFMAGFPCFAWWLVVLSGPARPRRRDLSLVFLAAALLYFGHALWFLAGLVWLGVRALARRAVKTDWPRALAVAPLAALLFLQSRQFEGTRYRLGAFWYDWPINRFGRIDEAALGALRGPIETIVIVAALLWIAAGLLTRPAERAHRELAGAGALLVAAFAILPDTYMNTIEFAQRWLPFAIAFLVLAVPPPRLDARILGMVVAATVAAFAGVTAATWRSYQDVELAGLEDALEGLPPEPRVLGLVFVRGSERFRPPVTLQIPAYAQVTRGGRLHFSFAEHPASPVVFDAGYVPPWTPGLDWHPDRLRPSDLRYFDHVLASGDDKLHAALERLPELEPATPVSRWRLYRVTRR
jgi:hypothetical protein